VNDVPWESFVVDCECFQGNLGVGFLVALSAQGRDVEASLFRYTLLDFDWVEPDVYPGNLSGRANDEANKFRVMHVADAALSIIIGAAWRLLKKRGKQEYYYAAGEYQ